VSQFVLDIETEEGQANLLKLAKAFQLVEQASKGAEEGADNAEKEIDKLGTSSTRTSSVMDKLGKIGMAGMGLDVIASLASKAISAITGLRDTVASLSASGTEQQNVNDMLSASIIATTANVDEQRKAWDALQAQISSAATSTNFGDEDIAQGLTEYIRLTGEATVSTRDLSTMTGIARARNENLTESSRKLAKARKGDVEALKELTPLNKEQLATLNQIRDPAERGAAAMDILAATYEGLADTTGTASGAIKNQQDAMGDLGQAGGMLVNQSGAIQAVLGPMTALFRKAEAALKDNAGVVQQLALTLADKLVTAARFTLDIFTQGAKIIVGFAAAFDLAKLGAEVMVRGLVIAGAAVLKFASDIVGYAVEKLEEFAGGASEMAAAIGADGLARQLDLAGQGFAAINEQVDRMGTGAIEEMDSQMRSIKSATEDTAAEMREHERTMERIDEISGEVDRTLGDMQANIAYARHDVVDTTKEFNAQAKTTKSIANNVKETRAALTPKEAAAVTRQRALILELEMQILEATRAGNQEQVAQLSYQKAVADAGLKRLQSKKDALAADRQILEITQAQYAREQSLADLERQRIDEMTRLHEERKKQLEEQARLAQDAARAEIDTIRDAGSLLSGALSGYNQDAHTAIALTAQLGDGVAQMVARYQEMRLAGENAGAALASSAAGLAGVLGSTAAQYIKDTRKQAAIRGAFAAAEAGLLYATGNIPGGIAATAASVAHFAVAGGAGGGGGGGSRPSASAPQQTGRATFGAQGAEEAARLTGRYIAEALSDRRDTQQVSISIDLSNSTLLEDSATTGRRLTQTVRDGLAKDGIVLRR
jgi:hypothetical protein